MLAHADKLSIEKRFEITIAKSSDTAIKFRGKSSFEIAKAGAISSNQEYTNLLKLSGRTTAGVKCKKECSHTVDPPTQITFGQFSD